MAAPRCGCGDRAILDADGDCARCGREIRALGALARAWRLAAYQRELAWARGEGLCPRSGFRGLSGEIGANPAVERLHGALTDRLDALEGEISDDAFAEAA